MPGQGLACCEQAGFVGHRARFSCAGVYSLVGESRAASFGGQGWGSGDSGADAALWWVKLGPGPSGG